jgi:hypothetical protein
MLWNRDIQVVAGEINEHPLLGWFTKVPLHMRRLAFRARPRQRRSLSSTGGRQPRRHPPAADADLIGGEDLGGRAGLRSKTWQNADSDKRNGIPRRSAAGSPCFEVAGLVDAAALLHEPRHGSLMGARNWPHQSAGARVCQSVMRW